ncbi:hypothetical protein C3L33_03944, partial [Rhododendron williamsianum]
MQLQEIQDNIKSRRNKIFLLMEEVRRLRVQQRLKSSKVFDENGNEENEMPEIPSTIPFLSHVISYLFTLIEILFFYMENCRVIIVDTEDIEAALPDKLFNRIWDYLLRGPSCTNGKLMKITSSTSSFSLLTIWVEYSFDTQSLRWLRMSVGIGKEKDSKISMLELKLGIGGTSYEDFIRNMHLPMQLRLFPNYSCLSSQFSQVDPIVASFSGGAVGVIAALMILEANNVEQQEKKRCKYCHGTGMC